MAACSLPQYLCGVFTSTNFIFLIWSEISSGAFIVFSSVYVLQEAEDGSEEQDWLQFVLKLLQQQVCVCPRAYMCAYVCVFFCVPPHVFVATES